ncbi:hypothetical protein GCM10011519_17860 [Marmoricola endophyticus]|uniref:Uncharacterized protein n=1 Tax=Marmoricola endophyticus TaxID=2040280 RepID=A0A917BGP9_9ACTN|nr:hypothetical protein GCM10011519_17860 [Marmoricola endophyticus]
MRRRAEGTPYVVTETESGFDVSLAVEDEQWWPLLRRADASAMTHHVAVDEGQETVRITDVVRTLTWRPDPRRRGEMEPVLSAGVAAGRLTGRSVSRTYQLEGWRLHQVAEETTDLSGGRTIVREVARDQGWLERRGAAERIGLVVGLVGAVGAVVTVVALLVVWWSGGFG